LFEFGFAEVNSDGKMDIQLEKNANIDKTCLVLYVSKYNRGGRANIIFCFPNLPNLGNAIKKLVQQLQ
jgi:hypothetical protein